MNQVCAHAHSGPSRGLAGSIRESRQGIVGQGVQAVTAGILLCEADEELRRRRQLLPRRPVQQHGAPEHRTGRSGHKAEAPGQQDGKTSGQGDARAGGRQGKRRCPVVRRMRHMEVFLTARTSSRIRKKPGLVGAPAFAVRVSAPETKKGSAFPQTLISFFGGAEEN